MGNLPAAYVAELENGQSHSQGPEAQLQQEELSEMLRRAMNTQPGRFERFYPAACLARAAQSGLFLVHQTLSFLGFFTDDLLI